jgi:hypothetical protein
MIHCRYSNWSLYFHFITCYFYFFFLLSWAATTVPADPCIPSPCGPNSQCRAVNGQAVCSCLPKYIGSPPGCRPECVVSSECPQNRACMDLKCVDPCPGTCGVNARCEVINHSPICSCNQGFTGDPFTRCFTIPRKPVRVHSIKNTEFLSHLHNCAVLTIYFHCSASFSISVLLYAIHICSITILLHTMHNRTPF